MGSFHSDLFLVLTVSAYADTMTYDVAVWKQVGSPSDEQAADEFERRFEGSEKNYGTGDRRPPCSELLELFSRMQARFPSEPYPPWEDGVHDAADGDFVYFTMAWDQGPAVVEYIATFARSLGLIVYDPQLESVVS